MTTIVTAYKVETLTDDEKSSEKYVSITTGPFHRLVATMTSRFKQYKITTDDHKKKLYHHACFPLLEKGAVIVKLEEYECKPLDDVRNIKVQLRNKYVEQIDPTILIKLKRPLIPEFKREPIDRRYREKNKYTINEKQRQKEKCRICHGRYTRANKFNHQQTTKHTKAIMDQIANDLDRRYPI